MERIILASASPRRIDMMRSHGFKPEIMPADIDEELPFPMTPEASVMYLAFKKACAVADLLDETPAQEHESPSELRENAVIIAADTVVVLDGSIIGKPPDRQTAFATLSAMKGRSHHVMTGVCIIEMNGGDIAGKTCLYEDTAVYFKAYSDEELHAYVDTDEPYDKAGGYAIQGTFRKYIDHIEGDFDNVVGFPWKRVEPFLIR